MPKFHEQSAPIRGKRGVAGTRGILQVSAVPLVFKLDAQGSIEHQNFFPKSVFMQVELRTGVVSHDGTSARHLTAISLQKQSLTDINVLYRVFSTSKSKDKAGRVKKRKVGEPGEEKEQQLKAEEG